MRLSPTADEGQTDWWIASRRFFDGENKDTYRPAKKKRARSPSPSPPVPPSSASARRCPSSPIVGDQAFNTPPGHTSEGASLQRLTHDELVLIVLDMRRSLADMRMRLEVVEVINQLL